VWELLEDAYRSVGLEPSRHLQVSQGSWTGDVGASGSTHDAGAAFDLRTSVIPRSTHLPLVDALRRRGVAAWLRGPAWGQSGMGEHLHGIARGETGPVAPSPSGAWQVREYDAGRSGLTSGTPDYHPRPPWALYVYKGEDDMPTAREIADAVWAAKMTDPVNGETVTARTLLQRTRTVATQGRDAARAAERQTRPDGSTASLADFSDPAPAVAYVDVQDLPGPGPDGLDDTCGT
jgi:hypothetical protein